jgi:peptidoglycan/xylan/chitin deacetylase (PgdA/CDA1 family)
MISNSLNLSFKECLYGISGGLEIPRFFHKYLLPHTVSVIMYHGVISEPLLISDWCFLNKKFFEWQIKYIKKNFEVRSLYEIVNNLKKGIIDKPTLAITFDDGFYNNYSVAFPILEKEKIPFTIFPVSSLINTNDTVWFCKLNRAIGATEKEFLEIDGFRYNFDNAIHKAQSSAELQSYLKGFPHSELQIELNNIIDQLLGGPLPPLRIDSPFRMLDSNSIKKMIETGLVDFGAHTLSHSILSSLSSEEKRFEIIESIRLLERITKQPCKMFAYPNGRSEDFDRESIEILRSQGIEIAVTTLPGIHNIETPPLEIKRYGIGAETSCAQFKHIVHHLTSIFPRTNSQYRKK